jgi:aconitate hydratase
VLALTFADPATYDLVGEDDRISILDLAHLTPDVPVRCAIHKPDGAMVEFQASHTMNDEQIEWFKAGSALNIIRSRHAS